MNTLWDIDNELEDKAESHELSAKEKRIEAEKQQLITNLAAYNTNALRDQIAWILNHFPETRDSDILLQIKYWEAFESNIYNGYSISPEAYKNLTKLTSISRERARIQNQYKLFLASEPVRQQRGTLADEAKDKAVDDKPAYPIYDVYIDESGKQAANLIVGGMWVLAAFQVVPLSRAINELKGRHNYRGEFHFKELKSSEVMLYRSFMDTLVEHSGAVSFKLISCPRHGISKVPDALNDLTYHLLSKGITHEHDTGRAPLPRKLRVYKDAEEVGADRLMLANLRDRLANTSQANWGDKLQFDVFEAMDSKGSWPLQAADLLVSSANRVFNNVGEKLNHKDEVAQYVLEKLKISELGKLKVDTSGSIAVHIAI